MKLTIYNDNDSFNIYDCDILKLELSFNISVYGKEWSHIGDYLYDYYTKEDLPEQPESLLKVSKEQYIFLLDLYKCMC